MEEIRDYLTHVNRWPSKRRFCAGLDGGMIASGVPPPMHGGIYRGLGINGPGGHSLQDVKSDMGFCPN